MENEGGWGEEYEGEDGEVRRGDEEEGAREKGLGCVDEGHSRERGGGQRVRRAAKRG